MIRSALRLGAVLGIAVLLVMASSVAWAAPVSFLVGSDDFAAPGLLPPGLGTSYQLYLSISSVANLFADTAMDTVISLGVITAGADLDMLIGTGPFSLSSGGGGAVVINATLNPTGGGFLSGPLLAQVTLNGNFNDTNVVLSSVPEPTTLLLLGPSLAGLALLRRRWQKPIEA
jgi:hypothetical protein